MGRPALLLLVLAAGDGVTNVVVIGATSAIAQETARCYAAEGASFLLVARDAARCELVAADLRARGGASVVTRVADLADVDGHDAIVQAAEGTIDVVLLAHGVLQVDRDPDAQVAAFTLNATSFVSLAARFANRLERQGSGTLAVIGSVAGDRGRPSNYPYGAAKAAIHAYCEGLRARVNVCLVKPGWIDTPMTAGHRKNALFASAAAAGRAIHAAIAERRGTVYVPWFWRWISLVVRLLPARLVRF